MACDVDEMNILKEEYLRLSKKFAELKELARVNMDLLFFSIDVIKFPDAKGELDKVQELIQALMSETEVFDFVSKSLKEEQCEIRTGFENKKVPEEREDMEVEEVISNSCLVIPSVRAVSNDESSTNESTEVTDTFQLNQSANIPVSTTKVNVISEQDTKGNISNGKSFTEENQGYLRSYSLKGKKMEKMFKYGVGVKDLRIRYSSILSGKNRDNDTKNGGIRSGVNCGEQLSDVGSLRLHHKVVKGSKETYKCSACGKEFYQKCQYNRHLKFHSSTSTAKGTCDKYVLNTAAEGDGFVEETEVFNNKVNGKSLEGVEKCKKDNSCVICRKKFKTKNSLNLHGRTHRDSWKKEDTQICAICGKQCKSRIAMLSHHRIHENNSEVHKCSSCGKEFNHRWQYNRHLHHHASEKSFICDFCGKTFKTVSNMRCHIALIHMKKYQQECKLCGKLFSRMSNLTRHLRTHSGEKQYKCSICLKAFSKLDTCKSHELRHSGNYAHPCSHCGKGFDFPSQLRFHQKRFHSEVIPCFCSICSKSFASNAEAQSDKSCQGPSGIHKLVWTNIKHYKCVLCPTEFSEQNAFASHILSTHIGELDHCILCKNGEIFTSPTDLEWHMNNVHLKLKIVAEKMKKKSTKPDLIPVPVA